MAKNMSFMGRYGNSCGIPFNKEMFCLQHREWGFLKPYLHDRPQQPWTEFTIHNGQGTNTVKKKEENVMKIKKTKKKKINLNFILNCLWPGGVRGNK